MLGRILGVGFACGALCAASSATVSFTFDDPGAGPEFLYTAGTDQLTQPGHLSFVGGTLDLIIDASEEGLGVHAFQAALVLEVEIGAVQSQVGDLLISSIIGGAFEFREIPQAGTEGIPGNVILAGSLSTGGVATFTTSGAVISTSTTGGLVLSEGPVLAPILAGASLAPTFDVSFTLTNIRNLFGQPGATLTPDGFISSFTANSAFTGNAELATIPTPGATVLLLCGACLALVRRSRG